MRMELKMDGDLCADIAAISGMTEALIKAALYEGAGIVADAVRAEIEALPREKAHRLRDLKGNKMSGTPNWQKQDLLNSLGITPVKLGRNGNFTVKVGFNGYGSHPTEEYPDGLPNALLARSIESGSIVREKNPFVKRALRKSKEEAITKMQEAATNKIKTTVEDKA